ncbi:MAG: hypothetical protein HOP29_14760 [Phycisphaerales bacterium]|nr:hypothetical protein [Phycisphaerales bacterium]
MVVTFDPSMIDVLPAKAAEMVLRPGVYESIMRVNFADAVIAESGRTTLANQDAAFFVSRMKLRAAGQESPMTQLQYFTTGRGYSFWLTFQTAQERFDSVRPVFELMAARFGFTGDLIQPTSGPTTILAGGPPRSAV